jgi:hypothetical protein
LENPSGAVTQFSMIKHPNYDLEKCPYIFLKDCKFVSIIDVKARRVLPIIRSSYEMEQLNVNNMKINIYDYIDPKSLIKPKPVREELKEHEIIHQSKTWIYTLECKKNKDDNTFNSDVRVYLLDANKIGEIFKNTDWKNLPANLKKSRD